MIMICPKARDDLFTLKLKKREKEENNSDQVLERECNN